MGTKSKKPLGKDHNLIRGAFGKRIKISNIPKVKLICRGCTKKLNNKEKNFPITMRNKAKDIAGKMNDAIVGYLCKKCSRKVMLNKQKNEQMKRKGLLT